jgi:hypothetical protein
MGRGDWLDTVKHLSCTVLDAVVPHCSRYDRYMRKYRSIHPAYLCSCPTRRRPHHTSIPTHSNHQPANHPNPERFRPPAWDSSLRAEPASRGVQRRMLRILPYADALLMLYAVRLRHAVLYSQPCHAMPCCCMSEKHERASRGDAAFALPRIQASVGQRHTVRRSLHLPSSWSTSSPALSR